MLRISDLEAEIENKVCHIDDLKQFMTDLEQHMQAHFEDAMAESLGSDMNASFMEREQLKQVKVVMCTGQHSFGATVSRDGTMTRCRSLRPTLASCALAMPRGWRYRMWT